MTDAASQTPLVVESPQGPGQRTILQLDVDLLERRVTPVYLVSGDGEDLAAGDGEDSGVPVGLTQRLRSGRPILLTTEKSTVKELLSRAAYYTAEEFSAVK